jgi:hypothetical protein
MPVNLRRAYLQPQQGYLGDAHTVKVFGAAAIPILTTDLVTGNQVALFRVPSQFVVTDWIGSVPGLDSGVALTLSIGDAASNTRFLNASTIGRGAGGALPAILTTAIGFMFITDTDILLTATAGAGTPVAGSLQIFLRGFMGP